jgi:hypothetical protein
MLDHWLSHVGGLVQFLLAIWLMARLVVTRMGKWKTKYTQKEKAAWTGMLLVALLFIEAPLENFLENNRGGPRQVLGILALIALIWVTYLDDDRRIVINTYEQEKEE